MQADGQLRDGLRQAANSITLDADADLAAALRIGTRRRRRRRLGIAGSTAAVVLAVGFAASWIALRDDAADVITDSRDSVPEGPIESIPDDPAVEDPNPDVNDEPEIPADDAPIDDTPDESTSPRDQIGWTQIVSIAPTEVVSDGASFYALTDGPDGSELRVSGDGTTWQTVAEVPFNHIDAVRNGRVASMTNGCATLPRSEVTLTIHVTDPDGTLEELSAIPVVPEPLSSVLEAVCAEVNFLGGDGLVITGTYGASHDLVKAAGLGLSAAEIDAIVGSAGGDLEIVPELASALGISVNQFEEETDLHDMALALGFVEDDFGVIGVDIQIGFTMSTVDGERWEYEAGNHSQDVSTIGDSLIGIVVLQEEDRPSQFVATSADGVEWAAVSDGAGDSLVGGRLYTGGDAALSVTQGGDGPRLWRVSQEGAVELLLTGTEAENVDFDSIENNATFGIGDAGIAYLTGFTDGVPQEPHAPTALVVSTDDETWRRVPLPAELVDIAAEGAYFRMTVGSTGVLVWAEPGTWFFDVSAL